MSSNRALALLSLALFLPALAAVSTGADMYPSLRINGLAIDPVVLDRYGGGDDSVNVSFDLSNCGTAAQPGFSVEFYLDRGLRSIGRLEYNGTIPAGESRHLSLNWTIGVFILPGEHNITVNVVYGGSTVCNGTANFTVRLLKAADMKIGAFFIKPRQTVDLTAGEKARFQLHLSLVNWGDVSGSANISIIEILHNGRQKSILANRTVSINASGEEDIFLNWTTTGEGEHRLVATVCALNGALLDNREAKCDLRYKLGNEGAGILDGIAYVLGMCLAATLCATVILLALARKYGW